MKMRTALFVTCLVDTLRPEVGRATVAVLERAGVEVEFPAGQTCCGQLHHNAGELDESEALAMRFAEVFAGFDAVVAPSASCVGHIRGALAELGGDAAELGERTFELTQFLVDQLGLRHVDAAYSGRVAYHPTCHSLRVLPLGDAPLSLLSGVVGVEPVSLERSDECCGFGGMFAIRNAAVSSAMLADKLADIGRSGADVVCACDASCLLHIGGGLERAGSPVRAVHLAEILAG
jgi:L-lactate dehydrogenase complex protein LldE